ncbi:MAG: glycosyltransferase [Planctomycetota bacterium]
MSQHPRTPIHPWLEQKSLEQNAPGSILFQAGTGVFQRPGGGEIQLIKTGMALADRGHRVGLFNPWRDQLNEARIIHMFGLHPEFEPLAMLARKSGIGVVVSPICWYDPVAQWHEASGWISGLVGVSKWLLLRHSGLARGRAWRSRLLGLAHCILPNSQAEADQLVRLLAVDPARIRVVPNAVDTIVQKAAKAMARQRFGPADHVLYVGRIEPRKNVMGLIKACLAANFPLVIIGQSPLEYSEYEDACRKLAESGQVQFAGALLKDDPLLASAMTNARVFALPSWFETPGLAALEAAALETPVVITSRGSTRDYFAESAIYCDPAKPLTVQSAIEKAWNQPPTGRHQLALKIHREWTWKEVARITEGIYDAVAP